VPADAALAGVDENEAKSLARFMKRRGQELGQEGGENFDQPIAETQRGAVGDSPEAEARS